MDAYGVYSLSQICYQNAILITHVEMSLMARLIPILYILMDNIEYA